MLGRLEIYDLLARGTGNSRKSVSHKRELERVYREIGGAERNISRGDILGTERRVRRGVAIC